VYKKLTENDVERIRRIYWDAKNKGGVQAELTRMYDVHSSTICKIVNQKSWKGQLNINQFLYRWR
jgi:hypothetical protein